MTRKHTFLAPVVVSFLTRLAVPAALATTLVAVPGCLFGSPGPSDVSQGKSYTTGEADYDEFFGRLYVTQLGLGRAPDRLNAVRARLREISGAPAEADAKQLSAGVGGALKRLAAQGVTLSVETKGLDGEDDVSAELIVKGTPDPKGAPVVDAIRKAVKELAQLVTDMRHHRPEVAKLEARVPELEPGIETVFHKGGARKKSEVRKNLDDAKALLPLMSARQKQMTDEAKVLLEELSQALGAAAPPPPPPPAPVAEPEPPKKGTKTKKGGGATKPPGDGDEPRAEAAPRPAPKPEAAPKPAPKPEAAPKPADDFEP